MKNDKPTTEAELAERLDRRLTVLQPLLYRSFWPIYGGASMRVIKIDDLKQLLADAGLELEVSQNG